MTEPAPTTDPDAIDEARRARRARREPGGDPASDHPVDQARRAKITRRNP